MNNDSQDASNLAEIEQRLQTLTPCPASLDASRIMRAAGDGDPAVLAARRTAGRSISWTALAASWVGGAVAGALAMFLFLGAGGTPAAETGERELPPAIASTMTPLDSSVPQPVSTDARTVEHNQQWSRTELLISNQLSWPSRLDNVPLRARGYAKITTDVAEPPSSEAEATTKSPAVDRHAPGGDAPAASSQLDRDQLLRGLLGRDPGSIL